jgi:hypothetical protein
VTSYGAVALVKLSVDICVGYDGAYNDKTYFNAGDDTHLNATGLGVVGGAAAPAIPYV